MIDPRAHAWARQWFTFGMMPAQWRETMRPHTMTPDRGYQPDMSTRLYVYRQWTSEANGAWRLLWATPGADTFCHAEGECSARHFRTMRDAIAYGERSYGETAKRWGGHGYGFA